MRAVAASLALAAVGVAFAQGSVVAQESVVAPGASSTPPPAAAPHAVRYPLPVATVLPNGLRVVAVRIPGVSLVAADLIVPGGSVADPDAAAGVASLTAGLLTRGTAHRSARELSVAADALGARLSAEAGPDSSSVFADAVAARFPAALALLAEVVREPSFPADEVALAKQRTTSEVALRDGSPAQLARVVAQRALFAGAYGRPGSGTARSIAALDRAAVVAYHRAYYRPAGATLAIGGDLAPADAFALAGRAFGDWRADGPAPPAAPAPQPAAPRVVVVDQPGAGRTAIVVAHAAVPRGAADYAAAEVANGVLAGFSGRLNAEIRIKRGLSYGASAALLAGRDAGALVASTLVEHARAPQALEVVLATLGGIGTTAAPSAAELATRKTVVLGGYASGLETTAGTVRTIATDAFDGLPPDELDAYPARIAAVDAAAVARFARTALGGGGTVVLVGDAAKFLDALRAAHPAVEVVPAAELDPLSPSLRR